MQNKLKLNLEQFFDNDIKICYTKNRYRNKILEYLQLHFCADLLILFKIVYNLFTKLKKVYDNIYCKKHAIKKLKELKMGLESFNIFYSKFIKLADKLEFIKEILLQEFLYKLSSHMQD